MQCSVLLWYMYIASPGIHLFPEQLSVYPEGQGTRTRIELETHFDAWRQSCYLLIHITLLTVIHFMSG